MRCERDPATAVRSLHLDLHRDRPRRPVDLRRIDWVQMINALEVRTVKARTRLTLSAVGLIAGVAVSGSLAPLSAQPRRVAPPPDAKRIMVPVFRSTDKALGVQVANAVRERLAT